ncbi:MAG: complex I subunit 5 family protein [Chloroflexota bacterium]
MLADEIKEPSILPLLAVLVPTSGAVLVSLITERKDWLRNLIVILTSVLTLGIILTVTLKVFGGDVLYFDTRLVGVPGTTLRFLVDKMGAVFALLAAVLWVFASVHAVSYMTLEHKRRRFFTILSVTEAATLGVFLVGDYLSLYVFFELMGLAAYLLVVHLETDGARRAGAKYLFMTIIGGLALLMGIFLYTSYAGTSGFVPLKGSTLLESPLKVAALVLLILGFGVKAGMVPLHVWLPDAHPAAPSPASALLSGVMIKTGAYGILRTLMAFFHYPGEAGEAVSHSAEVLAVESVTPDLRTLGLVIIWVAIITMLTGVVLAVIQRDIKRTLAYSSVSQMGFILLGAGCLLYLGEEGGTGLAASLYHIVNHALFKGSLFLVAGSILFRTHELSMFRLGGLWRKMPLSTIIWCIATLGIMGIPLFNGFVSKTLLHHAILEAGHLAESAPSHAFWLELAEKLFIVASGGTVLYFLKTTYFTFFKNHSPQRNHNDHHPGEIREAPALMLLGSGALALGVIIIGLAPELVLKRLIVPVLKTFGGLGTTQIEHLSEIRLFTWENIKEVFLPLLLGSGAFAAGLIFKLFEPRRRHPLPLARWFSFDKWYLALAERAISLCFVTQKVFHSLQAGVVTLSTRGFKNLYLLTKSLDAWGKQTVEAVKRAPLRINSAFTRTYNDLNKQTLNNLRNLRLTICSFTGRYSPAFRTFSRDIALGVVAIAASLALILLVTLLQKI